MNKIICSIKYYFSNDKELYQYLKNVFGITPKNIFLYKLAFTHKSASVESFRGNKINNERLEYLGDAILGAIVAEYLYKKYPCNDEGFLTQMRSKIVSRANLNRLANKLGMDEIIQKENKKINHHTSIRGDAFEAFVGAVFIDKGYDYTRKIILRKVILNLLNMEEIISTEVNFKSKLIEIIQKEKRTIEYNVVDKVDVGHRKQYVVEVLIDGESKGSGIDYSIKGAEQVASKNAYNLLYS